VLPRLHDIWDDEGWQNHWWPERLGGVPAPEVESRPLAEV
jgi:hypothetical protein